MNKSDIDASFLVDELNNKARLEQEFESLKPRLQDRALPSLIALVLSAVIWWRYPTIFADPVWAVLLLLILSTVIAIAQK